jgi:hypothetical protein
MRKRRDTFFDDFYFENEDGPNLLGVSVGFHTAGLARHDILNT